MTTRRYEIIQRMAELRTALRRSISVDVEDVDSRTPLWMEREDLREELVNQTRMVHKVWHPDDMVAMCGAPLQGILYPPHVCDCVVCAEMDAAA